MNNTIKSLTVALCLTAGATSANAEFITTKSETLKVWMDPIDMTADGKSVAQLTVYENDIKDYAGFNMALIVPEGIKVAQVKQGRETVNDIFLTERAASTHTISCNMLDDGRTIKIISYSLQLDNYYNDDEDGNPLDALFTIGLIADESVRSGEYTLELYDIKFAEATTDASILPEEPITTTLTVLSEATAITEPQQAGSNSAKIYDLLGRPKSEATHGINIINNQKVLIK